MQYLLSVVCVGLRADAPAADLLLCVLQDRWTALHYAANSGAANCVTRLLEAGADLEAAAMMESRTGSGETVLLCFWVAVVLFAWGNGGGSCWLTATDLLLCFAGTLDPAGFCGGL